MEEQLREVILESVPPKRTGEVSDFWSCTKSLYLGGNLTKARETVSRRISRDNKSLTRTPTWTTYKAEEIRSVNLKRLKNKPRRGGFTLHKWHRNVEELESISNETAKGDQDANTKAYSESTTKILGVPWEKKTDVVRVNLEACQLTVSPLTKRIVSDKRCIRSAWVGFAGDDYWEDLVQ
ncbi:Hypothetical predicted protein [Paramuricea clavata]|uniref:Uncharacterized protein n=1 Tax=Paramuricea clavata TaxID=317549 RepID=A0A6S7HYZ4_PARCT|nr:Hypothetical predicted protein [Paramuricea clavata]